MKRFLIINILNFTLFNSCIAETNDINENIFNNIEDIESMVYDGEIGFYSLKISDNYETALGKLESFVINTISGEDIVDGLFNIFPEDQNLQERENLVYFASYYNDTFYTFSKFAIKGSNFKKLKTYFEKNGLEEKIGEFVYHNIEEEGLLYSLSTNQEEGILTITDLSLKEIVLNKFKSLQ